MGMGGSFVEVDRLAKEITARAPQPHFRNQWNQCSRPSRRATPTSADSRQLIARQPVDDVDAADRATTYNAASGCGSDPADDGRTLRDGETAEHAERPRCLS